MQSEHNPLDHYPVLKLTTVTPLPLRKPLMECQLSEPGPRRLLPPAFRKDTFSILYGRTFMGSGRARLRRDKRKRTALSVHSYRVPRADRFQGRIEDHQAFYHQLYCIRLSLGVPVLALDQVSPAEDDLKTLPCPTEEPSNRADHPTLFSHSFLVLSSCGRPSFFPTPCPKSTATTGDSMALLDSAKLFLRILLLTLAIFLTGILFYLMFTRDAISTLILRARIYITIQVLLAITARGCNYDCQDPQRWQATLGLVVEGKSQP